MTSRTASTTSSTDSDLPAPITTGPLHCSFAEPSRIAAITSLDVHVVANLAPVAVDLELPAEPDRAHQPRDDAVLGLHAGPVDVGQAQAAQRTPYEAV